MQGRLGAFEVRSIFPGPDTRSAAVVILVAPCHGHRGIWLTRRPAGMSRHSAQFALPGGRLDPGETPHEAALRELHEEMGIKLGAETIIGDLDDYRTRSGYVISPTVAWIDEEIEPTPNPDEVEHVFHIGLGELAEAAPVFETIAESERPVMALPLLGRLIHAPTAALMYQFTAVALRGDDIRVADYEQPLFAWR